MRNICFYFQIHQPMRFKRYRFFDIGQDHYYYDYFQNEEKNSNGCYYFLKTQVLLDFLQMIKLRRQI